LTYSIDTSALLDGWQRYYPPDVFPGLWKRIDELIEAGELVATEEVLIELEKKDDELLKWAKERESMFVPLDYDIQAAAAAILRDHPMLLNAKKNRSAADPFVIAVAKCYGCCVVTGETPSNKIEKPKIPDVCEVLGIRWIRLLDLFREQGWVIGP